ncbi:hypothetical protein AGLY_017586, partial [Aphis glycines]
GHRDNGSIFDNPDKPLGNEGNFREFLKFRMESGDLLLKSHFEQTGANATYISKTTQNELIFIIGDLILQKILTNVNNSLLFSIMSRIKKYVLTADPADTADIADPPPPLPRHCTPATNTGYIADPPLPPYPLHIPAGGSNEISEDDLCMIAMDEYEKQNAITVFLFSKMSSRLNIGEICDVLFEEIPSDDNSITSCDDSDNDKDYFPPSDDRNIYLLPSPIKNKKYTRSSNRQKCVSKITEVRSRMATHRQLFSSSENVSSNNENVSLTFDFHSLPSTFSDINNDYQCNIESTSIRPVNIETEIETQPVWSKKNDILIDLLPFTSPVGPTAVIHDLSMCTPTTIFKCLFTDEIVNQIVHHTNLYAYQKQLKTGKAFMRTNMSEMQCFIGMQLLMGIKNYPLMTYLKSKNINARGTVNLTRKFLPALKNDKHLKLGEYDWSIDEESTSIVKWRDKRIVSLLSNFHK